MDDRDDTFARFRHRRSERRNRTMRNSSLRRACRIISGVAASGILAAASHAASITYTMSGVADGSLGATQFSRAAFTVTAVGDTATIYALAPGVPCIDTTQATFTIDGVASGAIRTPISVAENAMWQFVSMVHGRCADGGLMWTVGGNPVFGSYDLASGLEVVALTMPSAPPGVTVETSLGTLVLHNNLSALTFEAQPGAPAAAAVPLTNELMVMPTSGDGYERPASNFQGLWYNAPAESEVGWGINFAHEGDVIFATWFTYDAGGRALWLTMTANKSGEYFYTGTISQTRGPPFDAVPFNPARVSVTEVGKGTLIFADADNGSFTYTVNGISQTKYLTRQVFGASPACVFGAQADLALATNFQGLWYADPGESEAGWGVNFAHQGDTIFATWFTYDFDGSPLWLSGTAHESSPGVFTGTLNRTTGPAFSATPWNRSAVTVVPVGTYRLTFANGNHATFAYVVNGVAQSKPITRQVLRAPGTVCV
jgi:hypothetical protein